MVKNEDRKMNFKMSVKKIFPFIEIESKENDK